MQSGIVYFYIACGGAAGACMRFFMSQLILQWFGKDLPLATLLVNILGSFSLGFLYSLIARGKMEAVLWKTALGIGFFGAFTTFSTFSLDTLVLLQQDLWIKGLLNIFLNVSCSLCAAWLGTNAATAFFKKQ
ncbi:MAG: CrcB protein [Paraglaciecola sp.]|jgi:CrcB protein